MKRIAKISGIGYLIIFITGIYANFVVLEPLINSDDPAIITQSIVANYQQVFYAINGFVIMLIFDLLLVWSLFVLLRKVNTRLTYVMAGLRFLNAVVFGMALFSLIALYKVVATSGAKEIVTSIELQHLVMSALNSFDTLWLIGLLFFSAHLLFLGWLILRSKLVPDAIGLLILLAALGYLIDSMAALFLDNYAAYEDVFAVIVIMPAIIGELSFTVWLLLYGFNVTRKPLTEISKK